MLVSRSALPAKRSSARAQKCARFKNTFTQSARCYLVGLRSVSCLFARMVMRRFRFSPQLPTTGMRVQAITTGVSHLCDLDSHGVSTERVMYTRRALRDCFL